MKKLLSLTLVASAGIAASLGAVAATESCQPVGKSQIAQLFDRWNDALQSGDPHLVAANYAPVSVLLPTLSNEPRVSVDSKLDYFEHFLEKHPVGHVDFRQIQIGCNTAIDTGLYTFNFGDGSSVKARYTYTYQWNGEGWLITSHHSSALPEPI
jgi:uncharacterized protein (TIGR02246 family)